MHSRAVWERPQADRKSRISGCWMTSMMAILPPCITDTNVLPICPRCLRYACSADIASSSCPKTWQGFVASADARWRCTHTDNPIAAAYESRMVVTGQRQSTYRLGFSGELSLADAHECSPVRCQEMVPKLASCKTGLSSVQSSTISETAGHHRAA